MMSVAVILLFLPNLQRENIAIHSIPLTLKSIKAPRFDLIKFTNLFTNLFEQLWVTIEKE